MGEERVSPGQMSLGLGANGIATCDCGNISFYGISRVEVEKSNVLLALQCTVCHKETPVPIDDPTKAEKWVNR